MKRSVLMQGENHKAADRQIQHPEQYYSTGCEFYQQEILRYLLHSPDHKQSEAANNYRARIQSC